MNTPVRSARATLVALAVIALVAPLAGGCVRQRARAVITNIDGKITELERRLDQAEKDIAVLKASQR